MNLNRTPALLAAAASLLIGATAFAQMPPPPPDGRPPAAGPAGRLRAPVPPLADTGAEARLTGRVARWLVNPNGEADGLLLDDGTQVAFAPHLSAALMDAVKPGDTVEVAGWRGAAAKVVRATTIKGLASGRVVADTPPDPRAGPPAAPRPAAALTAMNASGRVATTLYTDRGDINGALLQDGTIVRFPPHVGQALGETVKPGAPLYARGYGARSALGTALEATAIGSSEGNARELFVAPGPVDAPPPVR